MFYRNSRVTILQARSEPACGRLFACPRPEQMCQLEAAVAAPDDQRGRPLPVMRQVAARRGTEQAAEHGTERARAVISKIEGDRRDLLAGAEPVQGFVEARPQAPSG